MNETTIILPVGYRDAEGTFHRTVEFRPLTGKVEELLARNRSLNNPELLNLVLSCCLNRLGALSPVEEDVVRGLSAADRFFLLLELLQRTFGNKVTGTVSCPAAQCGEPVDIAFSIEELFGGISPTGEGIEDGLELEVNCPECSEMFQVPFDLTGFFFSQLRSGLHMLYREVHSLAFHYHWSETDILDMPREKRHMYIDILADEIERMNEAETSYLPPASTLGFHGAGSTADSFFNGITGGNDTEESVFHTAGPVSKRMPGKLETAGDFQKTENASTKVPKGNTPVTATDIELPGSVETASSFTAPTPPPTKPLQTKHTSSPNEPGETNISVPGDEQKCFAPREPAMKISSRSAGEATQRVEHLRSEVQRLNSRKKTASVSRVETEEEEALQQPHRKSPKPPARDEIIINPVSTGASGGISTSAFFERSYMGRFHLRTLR